MTAESKRLPIRRAAAPAKPSRAAQRKRLDTKRRAGAVKRGRGRVWSDD